MKSVPYGVLKQRLSAFLDAAERGEEIVVTRHRRPVARLIGADRQAVWVGKRHGKGDLTPLLERGSKGRYLDALIDDRRERGERAR